MKLAQILIPAAVAAFAALSSSAMASDFDEAAAKAFAKKNECTKCHAVDKVKKGASYQKIAAKYKGKPDAIEKVTKSLLSSPKVKMEDGTEEEHKSMEGKDAKELKNVVLWILAQ
jgi:cytochrome c